MEFETKFSVGDSVFYFRSSLLEYEIEEIYYRYRDDEESFHYTIKNKENGETIRYVGENNLFISKAQAVAKYLKEFK